MNLTWLYVAAIYAIAVALARRARVELPWRVAGAFYLLVLLFFFKPLTGPYVNVGPDVLKLIPPWTEPGFDKFDVSNYELQDVMFQFVPWTQQVHEQWRALRVPLWNERAGCGIPLLANMQSGALSPLRLLTIPLPLAHAMTAEAAMKILVALTFTFLYCRRRYDALPSMIGAMAFGFGTFLTLWLHFPHPNVAAFLPAVFYAIDLLAEQRTFGRFLFAASLGPIVLAGGHPETAAHILFFAALYALWLMFAEKKKLIVSLIAVTIVALLLAAPLLLPFLEILPQSISFAGAGAQGHDAGTAFSDFGSLALLVHPRIYGERPAPVWGPTVTETASGFAGLLGIGAWLGLMTRAIVQRRFRERETFFLIAFALTFLWLADVPFISAPFRALFSLALNARLRLQLTFFAALQTAALIHYASRSAGAELPLSQGETTAHRSRAAALPPHSGIATVIGALGALAFVVVRTNFPTAEAKQFALMATLPSLAVLALLVIPRAVPLVALALYAELWAAGHGWHPVHRGTELFRRTPLIDALLSRQSEQPYRIAAIGAPLFPNTNAPFGLEDIRAKDALMSTRYASVLRSGTRDWNEGAYYQKLNDADARVYDFLNVKWVLTEANFEMTDRARYALVYEGPDGRVWENRTVLPRFFAPENPDASVTITAARGDAYDLQVSASRPTRVVSSVALWPGWRVSYNGRDLEPRLVHGAFLGFDIPRGYGVVQVRYVPRSFWGGMLVALATLVAAFMGRTLLSYSPRP